MVTCTFICYSDIKIFTKYTLKKYLSKAQNQIPHGLWISTCKMEKKTTERKKKSHWDVIMWFHKEIEH